MLWKSPADGAPTARTTRPGRGPRLRTGLAAAALLASSRAALGMPPSSGESGVSPGGAATWRAVDASALDHAAYLPIVRHGPYYEGAVTFAVVGDYGACAMTDPGWSCEPARRVAAMVARWEPAFVVTTGDNNYPSGAPETWAVNTAPYGELIPDRFEPAIGNHDYECDACPEDAFVARFRRSPTRQFAKPSEGDPLVRFFVLDSNAAEPVDGAIRKKAARSNPLAPQRAWLQHGLASLRACWKLVAMHHPPYSSTTDPGSNPLLDSSAGWRYRQWGADIVLAGHAHTYERITRSGGFAYLVVGTGGAPLNTTFGAPVVGSEARIADAHGAVRGHADPTQLVLEYFTVGPASPAAGPVLRDVHRIARDCNAPRPSG